MLHGYSGKNQQKQCKWYQENMDELLPHLL